MLFRSEKKTIKVGGRFSPVGVTFGQVWSVDALHQGKDGREYAVLVSATDPTRRKTLATATLLDPAFFVAAG